MKIVKKKIELFCHSRRLAFSHDVQQPQIQTMKRDGERRGLGNSAFLSGVRKRLLVGLKKIFWATLERSGGLSRPKTGGIQRKNVIQRAIQGWSVVAGVFLAWFWTGTLLTGAAVAGTELQTVRESDSGLKINWAANACSTPQQIVEGPDSFWTAHFRETPNFEMPRCHFGFNDSGFDVEQNGDFSQAGTSDLSENGAENFASDFSRSIFASRARDGKTADSTSFWGRGADLSFVEGHNSVLCDRVSQEIPRENSLSLTSSEASYCNGNMKFSQDVVVRGASSTRKYQIWGNAYVTGGKIRPKNMGLKINNETSGALIGFGLKMGGYGKISGFYNFSNNRMRFPTTKNQLKTNLAGVSYDFNAFGLYFTMLGTYGDDSHQLTSMNGVAPALQYDGYQASGYLESGMEMSTGGLFTLKPFTALQYSYLEHESFDRPTLTLGQGKTNYDAFYSTMGAKVDVDLMNLFTIQGRMAWVHQLRSQNEAIQNIWFGRVPGSMLPSQVFYEGNAGRDYFWGGIGAGFTLLNRFNAALDYDVLLNSYQTTHVGSVELMFSF